MATVAEQMDVHEGTATVREAMRFSAYLRQPFSVPKEEKDAYVEEIIELLELHELADAIIGFFSARAPDKVETKTVVDPMPTGALRPSVEPIAPPAAEPEPFSP